MILEGKKGIIFGALNDQSIAWQVALCAKAQGADLVLTNAPVAMRMGAIKELAQAVSAPVFSADATNEEHLEKLFEQAQAHFGGKIDFVLHSIGMSLNVRKERAYTNLDYGYLQQTLDISAVSFHKVLQTAWKLDAMQEWGSILALSYIAAQRTFPDYNDMADAKALLESIARTFGYHFAMQKKVRVNTISQSPTMTTAGSGVKGFQEFFDYAHKMSPMGNASAESCASFCVAMFSDFTKMITMQNLYHDGGFSSMGMSPALLPHLK